MQITSVMSGSAAATHFCNKVMISPHYNIRYLSEGMSGLHGQVDTILRLPVLPSQNYEALPIVDT
jgi:hypothetical protein